MRKSYLILLSSLCAAPLLSAPHAARAYVYRYAPGVPAVTTDMSLLNPPPAAAIAAPQAAQQLSHPFFTTTVLTPNAAVPPTQPAKPAAQRTKRHAQEHHAVNKSAVNKPAINKIPAPATASAGIIAKPAAPLATVNVKPVAPPAPPKTVATMEQTAPPAAPAASLPAVPTHADLTLAFATPSSTLTPRAKAKLDNIAEQMKDLDGLRLQIRGYAKGNGSIDGARRMSLARVLTVRSYLMDKGIKPVRLDVQALGSSTSGLPIDRVDLVFER